MASAVTSLPIRMALNMEPTHPLLALRIGHDTAITAQDQSLLLSMSQDILLYLIEKACNQIGNGVTLASLICVVNCANTCKLLRLVCRYVRTFADSYDFVQTLKCRDDANLNRQRIEIHKMTGGYRFALQEMPSDGTNNGKVHESGVNLVILRDCNKSNAFRNTDNPFGRVYVLLAAPLNKNDPDDAWSAVSLSLKEGLELFSGASSRPDAIVHRGTHARPKTSEVIWKILGPEKTEDQHFTHADDEPEYVHDETVVGVRPRCLTSPTSFTGLQINTSYSTSEALSSIKAWLPAGTGDERWTKNGRDKIPLDTFFNRYLPLHVAVCNIKGIGDDRVNMMEGKTRSPTTTVEGALDIDPRHIISGRRRAAYEANAALKGCLDEDKFTGSDGRIQRGHPSFEVYAREAKQANWRDDQLAIPESKVRRIGGCNADSDDDDMDVDEDTALPSLTYNGQM